MRAKPARRVAITGLGPITAIGIGRDAFWKASLEGRSGSRAIDFPWMDREQFRSHVGAPVTGFEPGDFGIAPRERRVLDPAACFALAGAGLALDDAGLATPPVEDARGVFGIEGYDPERVAVILGTGIGGLHTFESSHQGWTRRPGRDGHKRYALPMLIPNALPAQVAIRYGARGECKAVGTACSAGTMATGDAFRLIRDGEVDLAITGGVESVLSDHDGFGLMGFDLIRAVSTWRGEPERASRPFDRDRAGFVLSEGAGVLVLEALDDARARVARVYAEVAGYRSTCDAHSMMQLAPGAGQIVRMMRELLQQTGTPPGEVAYLNAHGTGTVQNDPLETRAIREVFGPAADSLLVSATKSMTGHAIGASGGIEAIATALAVAEGRVPPTINLENPDPACDLDYVPGPAREALVEVAMTNSYGFGGHNASLMLWGV
jgi:3-oxoacyl-[acyl-carrier-protein] synthase II